jgi:hypothetical protein
MLAARGTSYVWWLSAVFVQLLQSRRAMSAVNLWACYFTSGIGFVDGLVAKQKAIVMIRVQLL